MAIKSIKFLGAIALACIIFSGCKPFTSPPPMTSLQLQAMQSREFETTKRIAFASIMTVFQDLGYIIDSADYNTGFITAESPNFSGFFSGNDKMKATAFIEELDNKDIRIRLNFVQHSEYVQQNAGVITQDTAILTPDIYQETFNKIQEAIFIKTPFGTTKKPKVNTK